MMSFTSTSTQWIESPGASAKRRAIWFALSWLGSHLLFWSVLAKTAALALSDERYTHIAVVPVLSGLLIWMRRDAIFSDLRSSPKLGVPLLVSGVCLALIFGQSSWFGESERLFVMAAAALLVWIGLAALCFGYACLRRAAFPVLFLLMAIPIPATVMDGAVTVLQKGSAEMTSGVFRLTGMPFVRNGFTFSLPGVDIEIAKECSGIRSSLSLLLSSIQAGYLLLRSGWSRLFLAIVTVPIVIFKNAVRIAILSWLGVYVDRSYFFGNLHHHGGVLFSLIAIAPMGLILWALHRAEGAKNRVAEA